MRTPLLLLLFAICLLFAGCAGDTTNDAPNVAVAASTRAQRELRDLEERWEIAGEVGRKELRVELEAFLRRYPTDPSGARVRLMLARIALSERRFGATEELLRPLLLMGSGAARDEAFVVQAAVENRRGEHEMALARLEPLQGKLLTRTARDAYAREKISAALALRRWRVAIDAMALWLAEDGSAVVENQHWTKDAVVRIPTHALLRVLSDWSKQEQHEDKGRQWLQATIVERLTEIALATQDPVLSRDLLAESPAWLRSSKHGAKLSALASMAQQEAQISGRSVGVVLGGETFEERRRAVRVAAGLLRGLGIGVAGVPTSAGEDGPVRFVAAEDRGSMHAALSTLSGLGATVLVAGVDALGAEQALAFAESKEVPVVVMSEPRSHDRRLRFGFVVGTSEASQLVALESSDPKVRNWRFVGTRDVPCEPGSEFPFPSWKGSSVEAIGILGDDGCVRRAVRALLPLSGWNPLIAVGLEAARGPLPLGRPLFYLSSGGYPKTVRFLSDQVSAAEQSISNGNAAPASDPFDWYFTIGHDAATLIKLALLRLPKTHVTEKGAVKERHKLAGEALEAVQADLVSTTERGFSRYHRLERRLVLREARPSDMDGASR